MKAEFGSQNGSKEMTLDDFIAAVEKLKAMGADGGRVPKVKINLSGSVQKLTVEV